MTSVPKKEKIRKRLVLTFGALVYALLFALGSQMEQYGATQPGETIKRLLPAFCVAFGVLWVLLAADARCVASDGETPLPAPSELTRQVPVRVADAYGLRALLVRLSLEAGDTSAFDRMQDLGRDFPSRDGASGGWGQDASYVLSAVERRVPGDADLILLLRKIRI